MSTRRTLARPVGVEGIGLFTESDVQLVIHPAQAGTGLRVRRGPLEQAGTVDHVSAVPVHPAFATMPPRCTGIDLAPGACVHTIEHVFSALAGLGVTDAIVEINGPEAPIDDGSSTVYVNAIANAGLCDLESSLPGPACPREPIIVGDPGGVRVEMHPDDRLSMAYHLDYGPNSPITPQSARWDGSPETYQRAIAPARTYSLLDEVQAMTALGLFGRFSARDFLVIGSEGPIDNTFRFPDEPARHKLLDLIGDLALAGLPWPTVRVEAFGSGHALNHEAARALRSAIAKAGTVSP
ncbi:MAG: UDP-3-O-acyl-N-acetylglucosamine deacetylase [Planctomycetota bacterium]|nr:MAG: UDP-3-O-acyl-N-acetylglucosamine deacetylase [Planctomycetota bacterium]